MYSFLPFFLRKDERPGRKEGRKEGRKKGRKEGRKEGRKAGQDGRMGGRTDAWKESHLSPSLPPSCPSYISFLNVLPFYVFLLRCGPSSLPRRSVFLLNIPSSSSFLPLSARCDSLPHRSFFLLKIPPSFSFLSLSSRCGHPRRRRQDSRRSARPRRPVASLPFPLHARIEFFPFLPS
jgi:hypothetical protein